ncbi:MAG: glycosyltransferase family 2 protein [Eubacteriales bacterium]|nr:glycosyltransferase family 2 protein [Eubacteriales bacterium]
MKTLVIIPAFNEEENIEEVVGKMVNDFPQYDYLVVNDCSKDATKKILYKNKCNYLNLPVNLGIGGAVQAGYKYALENDYDVAVQMDGDGQHNPEYIKDIIQPIADGEADSVIGSRFIENEGFQSSGLRRMGIKFLSSLISCSCGIKVLDVTSGFRAVNRKCIAIFANEYAQDYPEPEAIVVSAMKKIRIREVPVIMNERTGGVSSINGFKTVYYMIKVSLAILITRFTSGGKRK